MKKFYIITFFLFVSYSGISEAGMFCSFVQETSPENSKKAVSFVSDYDEYATYDINKVWKLSDENMSIRSDGRLNLKVYFIDSSFTEKTKKQVLDWANEWSSIDDNKKIKKEGGAYVKFVKVSDVKNAHIKVKTETLVNDSKLGNEAKNILDSNPTMNLKDINRETVLHEFGHALGFDHDQLNPSRKLRYHEQNIIKYITLMGGWPTVCKISKEGDDKKAIYNKCALAVRSNITNRLNNTDGNYDRTSIMHYPIPKAYLKDYAKVYTEDVMKAEIASSSNDIYAVPPPTTISKIDRAAASKLYKKITRK